jgi:hypothetical protein
VKAGVDTWSVCWYLRDQSEPWKAMEALAVAPAARSRLLEEPVAGHRVGWFPGTGLLFAEGHPSEDGLCPADGLPEALSRVVDGLRDVGIEPPMNSCLPREVATEPGVATGYTGAGFSGIRRLDSTVDFEVERRAEGLAVLAGVAAVDVPRMQSEPRRETGGRGLTGVRFYGSGGKQVLGRWYDKGLESGAAPRGMLIRAEDQRRFPKDTRLDVELVAESSFVRDSFVRRFEPLWRASKGVKVVCRDELADAIAEKVEEGVLSPTDAVKVLGFLHLGQAGELERVIPRSTRYKLKRKAADAGLVLADGVSEPIELDLERYIEAALDSETWGCG